MTFAVSFVELAECFLSIQGEGSFAGLPCVFIRLAGCNLDCSYCDSVYAAKSEGERKDINDLVSRVESFNVNLVEVTGGEPLIQPGAGELLALLCDRGCEVIVETNGSVDLKPFDSRAKYIVDIKTPGSGAGGSFLESNFEFLRPADEVKFIITSREDFDWAVALARDRGLPDRHTVLFSPAWGLVEPKLLAQWILESGVKARLNLQLHKFIWGSETPGV